MSKKITEYIIADELLDQGVIYTTKKNATDSKITYNYRAILGNKLGTIWSILRGRSVISGVIISTQKDKIFIEYNGALHMGTLSLKCGGEGSLSFKNVQLDKSAKVTYKKISITDGEIK